MKPGEVKHLFSCKKTHPNLPLKTSFFLHKLVRLSVIAPQGDSALAQNSLHCVKVSQRISGEYLIKWLLWTENEGQAENCLHCQHLADTHSKQGQKPWKEKAEKGSSESLSQQQVRTRLGAKVGQHKECEG